MIRRSAVTAAAIATGLLVVPAGASAASANLDKTCYVEGAPMVFAAAGFSNNSIITASGNGIFASTPGPTNGSATGTLIAPIQPGIGPTDVSNNVLNVTENINPANAVNIPYQVVNFTFSAGTSIKSPKKKRNWSFSGFPVGSTVWGHFRRGSKTVGSYKFGVAAAPCGTLTKKAAGLPKVKHIKAGKYKVQVDGVKKYSAATRPAVTSNVRVFNTFK